MGNLSLDKEEYGKKSEKIIGEIGIPSQPQVVMKINEEVSRQDVNFQRIADIISTDSAMTAKLLKVVNSAYFGLSQKVDSVQRALSMLGLKNLNNIILASSLRETLGMHDSIDEMYWDHSMATATISSHIAKKIQFDNLDQAYITGLFHDCGIPLMRKRFPEYTELADYALGVVNKESLTGKTKSIIDIEDERYATHHGAIGYLTAKSWRISLVVCNTIWHHHDIDIDTHEDSQVKKLSAILLLADYLGSHILYLRGSKCVVDSEQDWASVHHKTLSELGLDVEDITDFKDDFEDMFMWDEQEKI
jgi:putative nucleotidyltransferase with HDIG domain